MSGRVGKVDDGLDDLTLFITTWMPALCQKLKELCCPGKRNAMRNQATVGFRVCGKRFDCSKDMSPGGAPVPGQIEVPA